MLINCECCGKKISEDSLNCIHCGHPMKSQNELLFAYKYNGETLNSPLYLDNISKLDILQKVMKVKLDGKTYKIIDIICNAHDEIIDVIIDNYD